MKQFADRRQLQREQSLRPIQTSALSPLLELQRCAGNSAVKVLLQRVVADRSLDERRAAIMPDANSNDQAVPGDATTVGPPEFDAGFSSPGISGKMLREAREGRPEAPVSSQRLVSVQRDETMRLGPLIKDLIERVSTSRTERYLAFATKWGVNAGPFNLASTYLRLNWGGLKYWNKVRKAAAKGNALLGHIDQLERSARALKGGVERIRGAWVQLPDYPLQTDRQAGRVMVSAADLQHVERYYNTAAAIANDAMHARALASRALVGWNDVLREAGSTTNFTRKSAWEAVIELELRFGGDGSFRRYLEEVESTASRIEASSRNAQYIAADIIGKWTPEGFAPPGHTP